MELNSKDLLFIFLSGLTAVMFLYFNVTVGDSGVITANEMNIFEFVLLGFGCVAGVMMFLWMGYHCLRNAHLQGKPFWMISFLFGNVITSVFYYAFIYRKREPVSD